MICCLVFSHLPWLSLTTGRARMIRWSAAEESCSLKLCTTVFFSCWAQIYWQAWTCVLFPSIYYAFFSYHSFQRSCCLLWYHQTTAQGEKYLTNYSRSGLLYKADGIDFFFFLLVSFYFHYSRLLKFKPLNVPFSSHFPHHQMSWSVEENKRNGKAAD